MTTSCCSQLEEVNGVIILRHPLNIFTAKLSSPFSSSCFYTIRVFKLFLITVNGLNPGVMS